MNAHRALYCTKTVSIVAYIPFAYRRGPPELFGSRFCMEMMKEFSQLMMVCLLLGKGMSWLGKNRQAGILPYQNYSYVQPHVGRGI